VSATLFHHPDAGTNAWSAERFLAELGDAGIKPAYASMDEPGWQEALGRTRELAIVAGGDGTVAKIMREIDPAVPLAILPTGSANNIALSLGAVDRLEHLIRVLPSATRRLFRLGFATGSWGTRPFVEALGLGAFTRSVAELQHANLDGDHKLKSGRAAFGAELARIQPLDMMLEADGVPIDGRMLVVEVMNIPMIGPNIPLCPDLDLADQMLSIVYLPEEHRDAMLSWLENPEAPGDPPVRRVRARRVEFAARNEPLRFDDKTIDWDGSTVAMEPAPKLLTVLVPGGPR
jgi:diacylglycerol kinase family enzyme